MPDEVVIPATVNLSKGIIAKIGPSDDLPRSCPVADAGRDTVMAGLVDTHVHINEPGRTEWEGFATATRAAAAGGVTTLVDMPLNSIPATTTAGGLRAKMDAAQGNCWVDVGFWGGVVPGNTPKLRALHESGVLGFKCFLVPSGVEEFPHVTESDLRTAMGELSRLNALLLAHSELPGPIEAARREVLPGSTRYANYLDSRPAAAENEAIALLTRLHGEFQTRVHIVHLSSAEALPMIRHTRERANARGLSFTVETCPHYLYFAAEEIPDGATEFKCAPPIRDAENREYLWDALGDGLIDMVVTDHSPAPPELKRIETGDFLQAWGGIASLQISLPAMWTAAEQHGYSVRHLAEWMCRAPAEIAGLGARKGSIAVGCDADLVVWNPDEDRECDSQKLQHRHKMTPYAGHVLKGVVHSTYLRGKKIYDHGAFLGEPQGTLLKREDGWTSPR